MIITKKKQYENPMSMVVELQQHGMLMQNTSDPDNERVQGGNRINNWRNGGTTDEDIYM